MYSFIPNNRKFFLHAGFTETAVVKHFTVTKEKKRYFEFLSRTPTVSSAEHKLGTSDLGYLSLYAPSPPPRVVFCPSFSFSGISKREDFLRNLTKLFIYKSPQHSLSYFIVHPVPYSYIYPWCIYCKYLHLDSTRVLFECMTSSSSSPRLTSIFGFSRFPSCYNCNWPSLEYGAWWWLI